MIEIKNLYKSYHKKKIYENLNLKIEENKISCLIGASGYGKTTLLRILAGLEGYEKGQIEGLDGKRISFVFQDNRLMNWLSVSENICYVIEDLPKTEKEARLEWALKLLRLEKERNSHVETLSGGMQRRVAIARALVYESDLLLMDEPFVGLDEALKEEIIKKLHQVWQEKQQTVILVTHEKETAQRLGNIIDLEKLMK